MNRISLLDCTLRDGGYINNWHFGYSVIKDFGNKIAKTGIEFYEVGFLKNTNYDKNKTIFSNIDEIMPLITPKKPNLKYVAMIDINDMIPIENISKYNGKSIDGIRVIFKKNKIKEAYDYCEKLQKLGYMIFVQLVSTDAYNDEEFINTIKLFNKIKPYAISIVDTFGVMKKNEFLRLVQLANNYMDKNIMLGYHAHNNLQQAQGNAEAFAELRLDRKIVIDACVFGMGRGAGNLNLELFAQYLNENFGKNYSIEPMLEIMDEYLNDIYEQKKWGYSLPLYLSAINYCHPNYAIYFAEKNSLTEKSFNELLKQITTEDKLVFNEEKANKYYIEYQKNYLDDKEEINKLHDILSNKKILLIAPGISILDNKEKILKIKEQCITITVNFNGKDFDPDFVFCSNMKRYVKIDSNTKSKYIITSNMKEALKYDYKINFSSYISDHSLINDNSGLMAIKLLQKIGVKKIYIAGMDGYSAKNKSTYAEKKLEYDFTSVAEERNRLISEELNSISKKITVEFITPTKYETRKK